MKNPDPLSSELSPAFASGGKTGDSSVINILLIDDDSDLREMIRQVLRTRHNYVVHEAANGRIGLDMIDEVKPDLIILDLMLPGMSGIEILRNIHSKPAYQNIPVIVLSGVGGNLEHTEDFWREGLHVDEFMAKATFRSQDLLGRVAYLLKRHTYRSIQGSSPHSDPDRMPSPSEIATGSESETAAPGPKIDMSVAPPEEIVRIFIESWNNGRFGHEFDCLGEPLMANLTKAEFIARRRSQFESERERNVRQSLKQVLEVQKDERTSTVKVLRENQRGGRKMSRVEVYLLDHTPGGWKIINIKVPNAQ